MSTIKRVRSGLLAAVLAGLAGGGVALALADDAQPRADDQCVAQCDAQSDQCMTEAGNDSRKQRACDTAYDECLRKCG